MKKLLAPLVIAPMVALMPASAAAASSPSLPSPPSADALKADLAEPSSSDYVETPPGTRVLVGQFDATTYSQGAASDPIRQAAMFRLLTDDGWISGYGRAWVMTGNSTGMAEQILVFQNNLGATAAFGSLRLADIINPYYQGPLDTSPISDSYGVEDKVSSLYLTGAAWVKGNDILLVEFVSSFAYMESETLIQAEKENALAPAYTIQPAPPAAAATGTNASNRLGPVLGIGLAAILVIGLIAFAVSLIMRSNRRRDSLQAVAVAVPLAVQLSPDGRYWWDGSAWQDALAIAPAHAQRSVDGAYWWDGTTWRLVPRAQ